MQYTPPPSAVDQPSLVQRYAVYALITASPDWAAAGILEAEGPLPVDVVLVGR